MLDKVKELVERHIYTISFTYQAGGIVTCDVKRPHVKHLAVHKVAGTDEEALDAALELLEKVKFLESKIGDIQAPSLEKQKWDGGYYREILFEDYEVEFKRSGSTYVISDICRKDKHGFYIIEKPYEPENMSKLDKEEFHGYNIKDLQAILAEDEELYFWDTIKHLSGSAGVAIVKNGKVVKTKCLAIA